MKLWNYLLSTYYKIYKLFSNRLAYFKLNILKHKMFHALTFIYPKHNCRYITLEFFRILSTIFDLNNLRFDGIFLLSSLSNGIFYWGQTNSFSCFSTSIQCISTSSEWSSKYFIAVYSTKYQNFHPNKFMHTQNFVENKNKNIQKQVNHTFCYWGKWSHTSFTSSWLNLYFQANHQYGPL